MKRAFERCPNTPDMFGGEGFDGKTPVPKERLKKSSVSRQEALRQLTVGSSSEKGVISRFQVSLLDNPDSDKQLFEISEAGCRLLHARLLGDALRKLFKDSRTTAENRDDICAWIFRPIVENPTALSFQACCTIGLFRKELLKNLESEDELDKSDDIDKTHPKGDFKIGVIDYDTLDIYLTGPIDPHALQRLIANRLNHQNSGYTPLSEIMTWFNETKDDDYFVTYPQHHNMTDDVDYEIFGPGAISH